MHLLHVFPSFEVGGAQVRLARLMNAFGRRYRHSVLALDGRYGAAALVGSDIALDLLSDRFERRRQASSLWRFHAVLRRQRPDLLLTYNWGAVEWGFVNALWRVARHIHTEDGFGPDEAAGQKRRRVLFRRLALMRSAKLVVPSRLLQRIALEVWRLPSALVQYLPNGIAVARYAQAPEPALLPGLAAMPGGLVIGTMATLRREKNLPRLVQAVAQLTGRGLAARLVILGEGPERAAIAAEAATAGVAERVLFAGYCAEPWRVLGLLDVFAMSSDTEQMPLALIEAMAAALPAVATEVGDIADILAPENRPFVVAKQADALADALVTLLADPALRQKLGQANRQRAAAWFDEGAMLAAYDALWREASSPSR